MPLGTLLALSVCPDGAHIRKPEHKTLGQTIRLLLANKAMLIFTGSFVLLGVGCGMQIGLAYLHLTVYLGVKNASTIYFFAFMCSLIGVPFWNWFASRKGKHVAFFTGLAITIFFFIGLALMEPAEANVLYYGQPKVFWQYLITICCLNFCQVVFVIMPPAIIGDIANADMVESKQDETGTYYSIYTFCFKTVLGLGQGMALLMAGPVFGFDPEARTQTDLAATGLKLFMGWIPAGLTLAGALLMTRYPITRERYEEIQQKLKTLESQEG
jgi:GPH family glycoside/pentoside/hexuronide:cation symporter